MSEKKKNRFYNFTMLRVVPKVLKRFHNLEHENPDEKWHWERKEFYLWYVFATRKYWYKRDWIGVIVCAIISYFLKRKLKNETEQMD